MTKVQIKSEELTPFGGIFSGHGAIRLHIVFCNRLNPWPKMQIVRLSVLRNHSFSHEYLLLWWLMYRECHYSFDEPSLASSDTSYL